MTHNIPNASPVPGEMEPQEERGKPNGVIRIEDDQGHLLFCFNPSTKCIEIYGANRGGSHSTRKNLYSVNIMMLQDCGLRIAIGDQPNEAIRAELMDMKRKVV